LQNEICKFYQERFSINKLSKYFHIHSLNIRKILIENNIPIRNLSESHRIYTLDVDLIKHIL